MTSFEYVQSGLSLSSDGILGSLSSEIPTDSGVVLGEDQSKEG